jgi:mannose-6-phosphate isomerase-like protein (cupin superfamily)
MKKIIFLLLAIGAIQLIAQDVYRLKKEKPTASFDNIHVRKISDSDEQSSFLIWIRQSVRLHKHNHHTENIYVISGKGEMILGDEKFVIKKGDFFTIPKGTPHGLNVLSTKPVKVLSIQSPKFTGEDRIFINKD